MNAVLPTPSADALEASTMLSVRIGSRIRERGGWIPFSEFMQHCLYEPGLGYYAGGSTKLGAEGDFVTAPEISELFGRTLAHQVSEVLRQSAFTVTEFGAGSGRLAGQLLAELNRLDLPAVRYRIVEVSANLRARQEIHLRQAAPDWFEQIEWLDRLPDDLSGVLIANEVLDAMPVELVTKSEEGWRVRGVSQDAMGQFAFADRPPSAQLASSIEAYIPQPSLLSPGYTTELGLIAQGFVATVCERIRAGAFFLVDYGFPRHEFYHPQRHEGTLMSHYRHFAHSQVLERVGLQDVTAHVDFSAIAAAGTGTGALLLGYTSQANFLMNCGIADLILGQPENAGDWLRQTNAVQRLVSEAEMGELFKVLALGRGIEMPLMGFVRGDRSSSL
jgi:SAM-dependent MidA family methyltransferase